MYILIVAEVISKDRSDYREVSTLQMVQFPFQDLIFCPAHSHPLSGIEIFLFPLLAKVIIHCKMNILFCARLSCRAVFSLPSSDCRQSPGEDGYKPGLGEGIHKGTEVQIPPSLSVPAIHLRKF